VGLLHVKTWAKVNLSLEVLGKRADGFHEVRSVMQSIGIADELSLEDASQLTLTVDHEALAGEDNLVMRAAELLRGERGQPLGAAMRLKKRIPVAAGLGGGSADAAAALVGLEQLWGPELSPEQVGTIASSLGSDVPFFLQGGTALALGRGEVIRPIARGLAAWLVLLVPDHSLPGKTAVLYRGRSPDRWTSGERTLLLAEAISSGGAIAGDLMFNAFEGIASQLFPQFTSHRSAMLEAGASSVHLSGSGPAMFAVLSTEQEASSVATRLSERGYSPIVTRTLGAAEARLSPRPREAV
jgi:4-diphosphocytidyl-2-C-methyl-D-erythritol kinase